MICSVDYLRSSLALIEPKDDEDRHRYIKYLNDELNEEYGNRFRSTIIKMLDAKIRQLKKLKF
jgi:hypothetical protein